MEVISLVPSEASFFRIQQMKLTVGSSISCVDGLSDAIYSGSDLAITIACVVQDNMSDIFCVTRHWSMSTFESSP
eukprot:14320072-Ditylum_brightwellii.AAC.1